MNYLKKLSGETAIYGLSSIVGRFLNFLLTPFYTHLVFQNLTAQFGIVTELYSYVVFFLVFLTFGMETGYFRFMQSDEYKKNVFPTISTLLFVSSSLFVLIIFLFIDPISQALQYENNQELILLLALIVAVDAFTSIPFAKLRQQSKSKRFATLKIVNISVNIGFNLLFYLVIPKFYHIQSIREIFDIEYIVIYVFISNLIASVVTLLLLLPEILSEKFSFEIKLVKKLLFYSFPLLLAGLAGQTNEFLDRILLKHLIPIPADLINPVEINNYIMSQIGIYGANFKLAVIITLFIQAFRYAFEPMFFKTNKEKDSKQQYANIMTYFVIFTLFMFLGISLYIDIFKFFIGANFREALHIVPIILFSQVLLGILFNLSLWYKLTDRTKFGLLIAGVGAVITIVFNIILIPKFSYVGAAWTHVICYLSIVTLSFFLGKKYYKVPYDVKSIMLYIIFALILYFISTYNTNDSIIIKLSINSLILLSFIVFVFLKEKISIKSLIPNGNKNR